MRGFTLIELSIVLIIIGLLVGGVLAGRDLIRQAELSAVVSDMRSYRTAFNTFQLKYGDGVIPGDWDEANSFWSATANGDGNGLLDDDEERVDFMQQLSLAGLVDGNYNGTLGAGGDRFSALNMQEAAISSGFHIANSLTPTDNYYGTPGRELGPYMQFGARMDNDGWPIAELLSAADAQRFDAKMDDGTADGGKVWVSKGRLADDSDWGSNCVANEINGTDPPGAWDFSTDAAACRVWISLE